MEENKKHIVKYYGYGYIGLGNASTIMLQDITESKDRNPIPEEKLPKYVVAYNFLDIKKDIEANKSKTYVVGEEVSINEIPDNFYINTKAVQDEFRSKGIEKIIHLGTNHYETQEDLDYKFENNWELQKWSKN